LSHSAEEKKRVLKEVIKQLHAGVPPEQVKGKFKKLLETTTSEEIAKIEQELVQEGMPREELQRLCDVHLAVFSEQLGKQQLNVPAAHPISILMEEHKILTQRAERLQTLTDMVEEACDIVYVGDVLKEIQQIAKKFQEAEKHYLREENVLFPVLEKHGITEPPAIMWMEHNQIREKKKQLADLAEKWNTMTFFDFKKKLVETAKPLSSLLPNHYFKENNILFPAALQTIQEGEWQDIREEFDEIGYCCYTPSQAARAAKEKATEKKENVEGLLQFETGTLSREEAEAILDSLPVDISFIDKDDSVKYFNKAEKRIFVRTKAVIGRKVQQCHPEKSVHIVNKIIDAFRKGRKDMAEFWITMNSRLVHIRYFAVRTKKGKYLGTLEVTQDITDIKKLEGQKRLLDWKE
jgi:PAS domain S-box-containing protein